LKRFSKVGEHNIRLVNRARIILTLDTSGGKKAEKQEAIAGHFGVSRQTVNNAKNDFLAKKRSTVFTTEKIVLVMDNLNTHAISSLYEIFPLEKRSALLGGLRFILRLNTEAGLT